MAISAWAVVTLIIAWMATLAIWSRTPKKARGLSVASFIVASPIAAVAIGAALGNPIPLVNGITSPAGEWTVLGVKMIVNRGIYVLIDNSDAEPRYFVLPWSNEMADKLQDMLDKGEQPMVTVPEFEWSWDQHPPTFQPAPQPKILPDKPREEPRRYERDASISDRVRETA